jgi:hypothetical protein
MAKAQTHHQPALRFTWRNLAGLFDEAWHREQRRRRLWLLALAVLIAAGAFIAVLTGGGGSGSAKPGPNVALRPHAPTHSTQSSPLTSRFALFT